MRSTVRLAECLVLGVGLLVTGCNRSKPVAAPPAPAMPAPAPVVAQATPADPEPPPPGRKVGHDPQAQHVIRGREKRIVENDFRQFGLYIRQYELENSKLPNRDELATYIKRDMRDAYRSLVDGSYVVVPNSRLDSNHVLVYEKDIDINGNQVVLFGDGSVRTLQAQDVRAALRNQ